MRACSVVLFVCTVSMNHTCPQLELDCFLQCFVIELGLSKWIAGTWLILVLVVSIIEPPMYASAWLEPPITLNCFGSIIAL